MTAVIFLVLLAILIGRSMRRVVVGGAAGAGADGWVVEGVTGLVLMHLVLLLFDLLGWPWRPLSLFLVALVLLLPWLLGGWWRGRSRARRLDEKGWKPTIDGTSWAAWGAVALFGHLAFHGRIDLPDFVYHWGIKAHRAYLALGTDFAYLADPLHLAAHPDYPNLVPNLYALTYLAGGAFDPRASMLWSVVLFAAMVLSAQEACRRLAVAALPRQAVLGLMAAAVALFGIGYRIAGGADWFLALAPLLALPALVAPGGRDDDLRLGVAAALAAGSKIEGPALAAALAVVWLFGRWRRGELRPAAIAVTVLPTASVVAPWLALNWHHGLFQATNTGWPDLARSGEILTAVLDILNLPEWYQLPWVVLAIPPLLAWRPGRPLALVCGLQLGFYLFVYFTAPVDVDFYVRSSLPRLLFHLVPVLLVAASLGLLRGEIGSPAEVGEGD